MQRRWSEGSTGRAGELEMPREAFQRFRDSSFWSGQGCQVQLASRIGDDSFGCQV